MKLDLTSAYQQVQLDPESLYEYTRLPFGIASTPSIFQRLMEDLLRGIPKVSIYLDDILVTGTDSQDHLHTLELVLQKMKTAGLTLKQSKCVFGVKSIQFLGHIINDKGLHPSPEKVRAIQEAPEPRNVT